MRRVEGAYLCFLERPAAPARATPCVVTARTRRRAPGVRAQMVATSAAALVPRHDVGPIR
jgi:hypothetical protein